MGKGDIKWEGTEEQRFRGGASFFHENPLSRKIMGGTTSVLSSGSSP
jgi:hypothetical protein